MCNYVHTFIPESTHFFPIDSRKSSRSHAFSRSHIFSQHTVIPTTYIHLCNLKYVLLWSFGWQPAELDNEQFSTIAPLSQSLFLPKNLISLKLQVPSGYSYINTLGSMDSPFLSQSSYPTLSIILTLFIPPPTLPLSYP